MVTHFNPGKSESPVSFHATILIVDDNPQSLQVLGKQLMDNGYSIEFAANGEAALEWINKKKFDLILLDINMPGMNGFEVCIKIRSNHTFDNIPVIFLSSETDRESILKGFELGAQDYITKPFDSRELLSRVKTHLILKESLEKLENQNIILEAAVAERTEQLKSALKQLEELNLKLLELDKVKSEFLSLVSHQIRTPLNGIIGSVELLKESGAVGEIAELIEILDLSVKRLEKFSLNALLITRLKTKKYEVRKERVSLKEIINGLIKASTDNINQRNLSVIFNDKSLTPSIGGESELIKKCIENIFENAVSFSPIGGTIEIKVYDEEDYVICELIDNGPGFKNEDMDKIFEIFSMGDAKSDTCLGIGLPICKLIMEAHSGKIHAGNNLNGGAFVKLFFKR